MPLTCEELYTRFRIEVDDQDASDPLWSEAEVYSYMDLAQKEFARITDCFNGTDTADITADDPMVAISDRFTKIRSAKLASTGRPLRVFNYLDMEGQQFEDYGLQSLSSNWETIVGTPTAIVLDMVQNEGRLVGIPTVNDTLNLVVYRLPLTDIEDDTSTIELQVYEYQLMLLDWMKHLAYSKQDAEVFNPGASNSAKSAFTDNANKAKREYKRLRRKNGVVRYAGL